MRGLSQLVPYFECQYPQVVPGTMQAVNSGGVGAYVQPFAFPVPQSLAPGNNRGLADYLANFPWPIPQYLTPGNSKGLGCGCGCGGGCESGLGQGSVSILGTTIQLSAPGGYFSTADFTQWGVEEWGTVAGAVYLIFSLIGDTKKHYRKASKAAKSYRSAS